MDDLEWNDMSVLPRMGQNVFFQNNSGAVWLVENFGALNLRTYATAKQWCRAPYNNTIKQQPSL
jgi:hypothetical protein